MIGLNLKKKKKNFTIDNFCFWAKFFGFVYFVLDFRSINFFYGLQNEKNARITNFFTNL